ncbi:MAG: hypothetical protein ACK5QC_04290 [Bacteroidota bacterium]
MNKIILVCTLLCTSCSVWNKIPDDTKHFAAGAGVNVVTTAVTLKLTKKKGLSLATGLLTGVAIGYAKERVWDKQWNRGVYNINDFAITAWGSLVATPAIFCVRDARAKRMYYRLDSATFNRLFVDSLKN